MKDGALVFRPDVDTAVSRFVYGYFSRNTADLIGQLTEYYLSEIGGRIASGRMLDVVAQIADATAWNGGPEGPSPREIQERVAATGRVLEAEGMPGVDAGKFYAAFLLAGVLLKAL